MWDAKKAYVNFGIRPLTVVFAVWGIYSLLHRDWLDGAVLIAGWVAVSIIGYDVEKPSAVEMRKGDEYLMVRGATKVMLVCFPMFAVVLVNRGVPWYFGVPSGFLVAVAMAMIPMTVVVIVAARRARRERH